MKSLIRRFVFSRYVLLTLGIIVVFALVRHEFPVLATGFFQPAAAEQADLSNPIKVRAESKANPRLKLQDSHPLRARYVENLAPGVAAPPTRASIWQTLLGGSSSYKSLQLEGAQPLNMATADFNADGFPDLVCAYQTQGGGMLSLYQGNQEAFSPQNPAIIEGIKQGRFPEPFQEVATAISLPEAPDFVVTGDFDRDGHADIVVAARGGSAFYLLSGDGHGGFSSPVRKDLPGTVTAMAAGELGKADSSVNLILGVNSANGPAVLAYHQQANILDASPEFRAVADEVQSLALGRLDDDQFNDLAVLAGGKVMVIHGKDNQPGIDDTKLGRVENIPLAFSAKAISLGEFVWDRESKTEMAVMSGDNQVHILARGKLDTRPFTPEEIIVRRQQKEVITKAMARGTFTVGRSASTAPQKWAVVEDLPVDSSVDATTGNSMPIMLSSRMSAAPADDLVIKNNASRQVRILSKEPAGAGQVQSAAQSLGRSSTILDSKSETVAALSMRVNVDGRPGLVVMNKGSVAPQVLMPLAGTTVTVNDATDTIHGGAGCSVTGTGTCSLRDAVIFSNSNPGADTIQFANGINPTLTITGSDNAAMLGDLDINDSVTITGNGAANTVISTNYVAGCGDCKVFGVNQDGSHSGLTVSISGVTIQNGLNSFASCGTTFQETGGGIDFFLTGTGNTYLISNSTIKNNSNNGPCASTTKTAHGGGVNVDSANAGTPAGASAGTVTFTNVTFDSNTSGNEGGGLTLAADKHDVTMTNCTVTNNHSTNGVGGGIWTRHSFGGTVSISGGSISSNTSATNGGGIQIDGNQVTNFSNMTFANNVATGTGASSLGGGIAITNLGAAGVTGSTSITNSTFDTNHASNGGAAQGGGVYFNGNYNATISGCEIKGNLSREGAGVFNGGSGVGSTLTINSITLIHGNTASASGGGIGNGTIGGGGSGASTIVSKTHIFSNSATTSGGGISVGGGTFAMSFSRIVNNTAGSATSTGLENASGAGAGTSSVADNWWGCSGDPSASPCDTAHLGAGTLTFTPFLRVHTTATPSLIHTGQTSALLARVQDSNGSDQAVGNLDVFLGPNATAGTPLPVAWSAVTNTVTPIDTVLKSSGGFVEATATYNGTNGVHQDPAAAKSDNDFTTGIHSNVALVTVLLPPSMTKAFGAPNIPINGTTALTFTITNPNAQDPINGVAFSDTFPAGVVVGPTPGASSNCGGTVTGAAGAGSVSFSGGTITSGGTCTVSITIQGTTDGTKVNTAGAVSSTDAGTANTPAATASTLVANPPTITKLFGATSIPLNGTTTLSFSLSNTNSITTLNGITFTDTLPASLVVATPGNLNSTCSGSAAAVDGSSTVSLSSASLTPGANCSISVTVKGTIAGSINNSVTATATTTGVLSSTSNANIIVVGPPTINKAFTVSSIPLNGSTGLSFTVTNPNTTVGLSGVAFTDNLPTGVVVAATPNVTGSCGSGTITATAGSSSISLSGGTLTVSPTAGSSCTFTVNVTGTVAGDHINTTDAVTSTEGGTGTASNSATLTVVAPPSIAKVFNPNSIPLGATTSLNFTITNPAGNTVSLTGVTFSDTLPTGLTVATASATACGGTLTTTAPTSISLTGATVATGTPCQFSVTVTGAAGGAYTNTTGAVSSTNGGTGTTATANLTVVSPPTISKSFNPTSIALNANSTLSFTISNPNTASALTGVAFTDNLPPGVVVAATPNVTGSCGSGTITAGSGSNTISLQGGTLTASPAVGSSCTLSVDVTGTTAGVKNNGVQVTSTEGGTGNTSNASLTVVGPPTISKSFNPTSIVLNANSTLSFTITNPNTVSSLSGVAFTDNLPAGVVVAATPSITGSCGSGTITATAGSSSISLSGGTLAAAPGAGSSCTFSVSVTGTSAGLKSNTTGAITSTEGGTGTTSNTATLTVIAPPSIAKVFNPNPISLNATTSLTFTITNPVGNTVSLTGVAFSDTLPTGLTVTTASATVCGGTLTTTAPTGISLTGATVATGTPCQFSVTVTGAVSGQYTNTTGAVTSTNGGTGNTATANLSVGTPPTISKSFNPTSIPLNGSSTLSFTITNPNSSLTLTGVGFNDSLAAGLVVTSPNGLTGSCGGGTITATGGSSSVSLSGATLASNASCTFSVNVTGTTAGVKNNSVQVTSTEGGPGNTSNASLTVVGPPTIHKAFSVSSIPLNGRTTLTLSLTNPNTTTAQSGVAFTDTLPAGLVVATPNNLTGNCGGGTVTAVGGSGSISLTGGALTASPAAGSSCTITVDVTGTAAGDQSNTTGAVSSTEGGTGAVSNTAVLTVVAPPSIAKVFNPSQISLNATTSLQFTITNPVGNTVSLTGVAFTDTLPTGLTVTTASATVCGGTLTATAPTSITLTGATVAVNTPCQFSVTVTGAASGQYTNTTGSVSSTNGGTGNTATANLSVATPPMISKSFNPTSIALNTNSILSFTITNPNASLTLTGVGFTDTLPAGLVVANPNALTGSCGGGTITATGGSSSVSLSGATLASTASCTFSVNVTGTTAGVKNNSVQVTSTEGGPGNTSNASVTVVAPPTISKGFGAVSIPLNGTTSLSFTITNPNTTTTLTGVGFTDSLPSGLVVATPNGLTGSCGGGTITAVGGSGSVSLTGATLASSGSCTFSVNVTGTSAGTKTNTSGQVTSTEGGTGGTASATLDVLAPPVISKSFGAATLTPNGTTSLSFTITNPAPNGLALTGIGFTDTLPSGLVISTPNGLTGSCGGGTITATAGSTSISLSGATLGAPPAGPAAPNGGAILNSIRKQNAPLAPTVNSSTCTFSVNVTATSLGTKVNTTSAVTSNNGGTGNTATATIIVGHPVPTTTSIDPSSATAGNAGFVLTVNGTGFDSSSVVNWNGSPRATTLVSPIQLTAVIPFTDIQTAGTAQVTVVNPAPGGGTSNPQTFTINSPVCSNLLPAAIHYYQAELSAIDSVGIQDGFFDPGSYAAGKVGRAFSFNGGHNVVKLPSNFITYPKTGITSMTPMSFQAWFKTTTGGVIFGQQDTAVNFNATPSGWVPAVYVGQDGKLYAQLFNDGSVTPAPMVSAVTVNDGIFHQVTVTYDGVNETLYLDGLPVANKALVQMGYAKNYNYEFGTGFTGNVTKGKWPGTPGGWFSFNGLVDDVLFYSRALTAGEAQAVYNGGSAGECFLVPTITSLNPSTVSAEGPPKQIMIQGTNFYSTSVVLFNGGVHQSNFNSPNLITITVNGGDLNGGGNNNAANDSSVQSNNGNRTASIVVVNPAPGGGMSNSATLTITHQENAAIHQTINGSAGSLSRQGSTTGGGSAPPPNPESSGPPPRR